MDAGNLGPVAEVLRRSYPDAAITIVADNDDKPGREINPGVTCRDQGGDGDRRPPRHPAGPRRRQRPGDPAGRGRRRRHGGRRRLRAAAGADLSRAGAHARGGTRGAGAGTAGVHGGGPGLLARRGGGRGRGGSIARHRPAGLQRAADRRAAAARPAGGCRARQVQLGAHGDRDPAGVRSARARARWSTPCRATTSARSRWRRSRRSACGRCSGRDARRRTPRRRIPSG